MEAGQARQQQGGLAPRGPRGAAVAGAVQAPAGSGSKRSRGLHSDLKAGTIIFYSRMGLPFCPIQAFGALRRPAHTREGDLFYSGY